ncbi:DUF4226 domain-containing protein [Mycolicibacterium stellerae]|uniref:DUF4226 domain-containing protein n=1 Tax=Mycolicibacterium stellerae TaxID=2358193 RepID=UPI000F0BADB1|nr:DUF4226 domain-containing protein [Mycolicibacterium stellerae]
MTHPSVDTPQSGAAADAVRTLQAGLSNDYSEMRSAEIQLTEAILSAHSVTVAGRGALQDIQRQLIEAINNPVAALDTPAGERGFLLFLRSKVAEIADIVETGALTDEDHAKLTRALASGYLLPISERAGAVAPATASGGASTGDPTAGMLPAVGSALGALPQAAQGAAAAPAQGAGGLAGAATPLAGLASGLLDRGDEPDLTEELAETSTTEDEDVDVDEDHETDADEDDRPEDRRTPRPPDDPGPPDEDGPAQTRPARLL